MLDREGNLLEQFRVINLYLLDEPELLLNYINSFYFPPSINPNTENVAESEFNWQPSWLPQGFSRQKSQRQSVDDELIESQAYSDGLFSFNLYLSDTPIANSPEMVWKQGAYTIYSETLNGKEITLIGQIPLTTAKRIVQDVQFQVAGEE